METADHKTFSFDEFELNTRRRQLVKNGQTVPLKPKAFDLLVTLIEHRGAVLSKDDLFSKVWANQFVEENNLTVHIAALRKALGESKNEHRFIVTFPGRGYSFVAGLVGEKSANASGSESILVNQPQTAGNEQNLLVGREREIREIVDLLKGENGGLLTLTGAGGSGKTRIARAIADEMRAQFAGGAVFVELGAVDRAELVTGAIAQALGVKESGEKSVFEAVRDFLRQSAILLVLDNFEQVLSAASIVEDLFDGAENLRVLVTSRAALQLKIEREQIISPLAAPPHTGLPPAELYAFPAVELFAVRARQIKPGFALSEENIAVVAEICRRLDGLPLAIELAAARIRLLSPSAILARLEHSLQFLTGGAKHLPSRQQTMRATVKWSYDLLDEDARHLFRQLAVFSGGFTVEAAEAVAEKKQTAESVLDLLTALVDCSLLVLKEQPDGNARLRMLEVVREFALEVLEASGEFDLLRRNHARFFLSLAEDAEPQLLGAQAGEWIAKLEIEYDNLRAAFQWLLATEPVAAARLAASIRFFWLHQSRLTEGGKWLAAAFAESDDAPLDIRLKLLGALGALKRLEGDYPSAERFYGQALAQSSEAGDKRQIALWSSGLGTVFHLQGKTDEARRCYEKGLSVSREINDDFGIAASLQCLAVLEMKNGETRAARSLYEEARALFKEIGNQQAVSHILYTLGVIAMQSNEDEKAFSLFTESLSIAENHGYKMNIIDLLNGFAALAARNGNAKCAGYLAGAAENLRELTGYDREPDENGVIDGEITKARAALGEEAFADFYKYGGSLDLNEAVALAGQSLNGDGAGKSVDAGEAAHEIVIENYSFSRITIEEEIEDRQKKE